MFNIECLNKLTAHFNKLPGIGPKTAMRLTYSMLDMPEEDVRAFAEDMYAARLAVRHCTVCGNLSDAELCSVCADPSRDASSICVVKDAKDVLAFERVREFRGVYHVLGGSISPLDGIGPDDLTIKQLLARIKDGDVKELILATSTDVKGEATAVYISKLAMPLGVKITRIAHGVPVGGELEYTDEITLLKALEGRREF